MSYLSEIPQAGVVIPGTGGCRRMRLASRTKGKCGGYRTITFFTGDTMPVFQITVLGKGEKSDVSKSECNQLRSLAKRIVEAYETHASAFEEKA